MQELETYLTTLLPNVPDVDDRHNRIFLSMANLWFENREIPRLCPELLPVQCRDVFTALAQWFGCQRELLMGEVCGYIRFHPHEPIGCPEAWSPRLLSQLHSPVDALQLKLCFAGPENPELLRLLLAVAEEKTHAAVFVLDVSTPAMTSWRITSATTDKQSWCTEASKVGADPNASRVLLLRRNLAFIAVAVLQVPTGGGMAKYHPSPQPTYSPTLAGISGMAQAEVTRWRGREGSTPALGVMVCARFMVFGLYSVSFWLA